MAEPTKNEWPAALVILALIAAATTLVLTGHMDLVKDFVVVVVVAIVFIVALLNF